MRMKFDMWRLSVASVVRHAAQTWLTVSGPLADRWLAVVLVITRYQ